MLSSSRKTHDVFRKNACSLSNQEGRATKGQLDAPSGIASARVSWLDFLSSRPLCRIDSAFPKVSPPVGDAERLVSLGCALQNMQLMAHALGFGAALTSGQALESVALRRLFDLDETEQAVCFLSIGTVLRRPGGLLRPRPSAFVQTLGSDPVGA
jgi:nitroreductase